MKKALHINSYFLTNKIHYNLYKRLKQVKNDHFLIPVYKRFKENHIEGLDVDYVFNSFDKKVFFTKIPKVILLFYKKKYKDFEFFHAHTVISDGLPTYLLHLMTGKPYVVSVRNTDISLFINGSFIFRYLAKVIIGRAEAVFFISPSLRYKIEDAYPQINRANFYMLPNGLDDYWRANTADRKSLSLQRPMVKLLFVGELIERKNLNILIEFLKTYNDYNYELHIVGKNTDNVNFIELGNAVHVNNKIVYHGPIYDKEELRKIYLLCDVFVLLSHAETFGVVYIEALSQGLPIIYSRGEGLDGFFDEGEVGYSCDNKSLPELHNKLLRVIDNYQSISMNALMASKNFHWDNIVNDYLSVLNKQLG